MTIDLQHIIPHTIKLVDLKEPVEIQQYCKKNGIEHYAYTFETTGGIILKHGMSTDHARDRDLGERIYRQAYNIPGWSKSPPRSTSGMEFVLIAQDYLKETGVPLHRNNVILTIYDMTQYPGISLRTPKYYVLELEAILINRYKQLHGKRPMGNFRDEEKNLHTNDTPDEVFRAFFKV